MKSLRVITLLITLALGWSACGDDDDPTHPGNGNPIHASKSIPAYQDNSLYQEDGLCAACPGTNGVLDTLSNGAGEYVFIGRNNLGNARRALFAFAIADSLPSNATIDSVELTLTLSKTVTGSFDASLHVVTAAWGEGASDASCCQPEEGAGGTATLGDATWVQRLFRDTAWTTPGGDFDATVSASLAVDAEGEYAWRSPQLASDVQTWNDSPATNFGWILLGDESVSMTAKRFDSHESVATGPRLTVYYSVPAP